VGAEAAGLFSGEFQRLGGGSGTEETVLAAGEAPGEATDAGEATEAGGGGGGDGGGAKAAGEAPEAAGETGAQLLRLDWIQSHVRCIDLPGNPLPLVFCS